MFVRFTLWLSVSRGLATSYIQVKAMGIAFFFHKSIAPAARPGSPPVKAAQ